MHFRTNMRARAGFLRSVGRRMRRPSAGARFRLRRSSRRDELALVLLCRGLPRRSPPATPRGNSDDGRTREDERTDLQGKSVARGLKGGSGARMGIRGLLVARVGVVAAKASGSMRSSDARREIGRMEGMRRGRERRGSRRSLPVASRSSGVWREERAHTMKAGCAIRRGAR